MIALGLVIFTQVVLIILVLIILYKLIKALVKPNKHHDEDHNISMRF